jgi:hypothetical protein
MIGSVAFLIVCLMIAPQSRQFIMDRLTLTGDWIQSGFPMSYILMFFTVAAPLFAFLVMATWPVREDLEEKAPLPYQQAAKTYQGMEE